MSFSRTLFYFFVGFLIGGLIPVAFAKSANEINIEARNKIYMVTSGGGGGSGFGIKAPSGQAYIVSNYHVCDNADAKGQMLGTTDHGQVILKVVAMDTLADLCLLVSSGEIETFSLAKNVRVGEPVHAVGHPQLLPLRHTFGYVISRVIIDMLYGQEMRYMDSLVITTLVLPGSSGSPLLNDDGEVVGVIYAMDGGFGLAIPLESLKKFLEGK